MANGLIALSGSSTTEIVAARSGARIRVLNYTIVCASASTITWKSGSTSISGDMPFVANGGASPSPPKEQLLITGYGEALNITHTASAGGHLEYEYVT